MPEVFCFVFGYPAPLICKGQIVEGNKCMEKHNYFRRSKSAEIINKEVLRRNQYLLTCFVESLYPCGNGGYVC